MSATHPFIVSEDHELIALHRSLFEAQFAVSPHDRDVPGSPILANLANRVVDLLSQRDSRWTQWRNASNHPDRVEIARKRLLADPRWRDMPRQEKEQHVRNHLAPLVPDHDLVLSLVGTAA